MRQNDYNDCLAYSSFLYLVVAKMSLQSLSKAVAGRAGRQAGPTDICVRKGDIAVTVGITLTWGTRSIVDMMPLCQEGRGWEGGKGRGGP